MLLFLMLGAAACAPAVNGINTEGQAFNLTIIDPQALVVRAANFTLQDRIGDAIRPLAEPDAFAVTWTGFPCQLQPSLEIVEGEGDSITVEVHRGPRTGTFCAAMEVGYGVSLVFTRPVDIRDLVLSVADGEGP